LPLVWERMRCCGDALPPTLLCTIVFLGHLRVTSDPITGYRQRDAAVATIGSKQVRTPQV